MGKTNKRNFVIRYMPVPSSTPSQGCCVSPLPDQQPGNIGERYQKSKTPNHENKKNMRPSKHSLQKQLGTYILGISGAYWNLYTWVEAS